MPDITPLRTFCWGILHALGMFDLENLTLEERLDCADERAWFSLGEALMAGILAACIAVPAGLWFAGRADPLLAFIGTAILFLPLFIFLPKLIRHAMGADTDAVLDTFGKNEQVKKIFWTLFIAMAGLVLAQIADPVLAEKFIAILAGAGG
jgi:hypothetical protein